MADIRPSDLSAPLETSLDASSGASGRSTEPRWSPTERSEAKRFAEEQPGTPVFLCFVGSNDFRHEWGQKLKPYVLSCVPRCHRAACGEGLIGAYPSTKWGSCPSKTLLSDRLIDLGPGPPLALGLLEGLMHHDAQVEWDIFG